MESAEHVAVQRRELLWLCDEMVQRLEDEQAIGNTNHGFGDIDGLAELAVVAAKNLGYVLPPIQWISYHRKEFDTSQAPGTDGHPETDRCVFFATYTDKHFEASSHPGIIHASWYRLRNRVRSPILPVASGGA